MLGRVFFCSLLMAVATITLYFGRSAAILTAFLGEGGEACRLRHRATTHTRSTEVEVTNLGETGNNTALSCKSVACTKQYDTDEARLGAELLEMPPTRQLHGSRHSARSNR